MTKIKPCHRCSAKVTTELPKPGLSRITGRIERDTWRIKFNYLRMATWEKAVTAHDVIASSLVSDVELCSDCWGDVLSFVNKRVERKP